MAGESPRKRSFGFVIPFRSKLNSRTGSIASSRSGASVEESSRKSLDSVSSSGLSKTATARHSIVGVKRYPRESVKDRSFSVPDKSFPVTSTTEGWERDKQTGEVIDHTEILHSLVHQGSEEFLAEQAALMAAKAPKHPGDQITSKLTPNLWEQVLEELTPSDVANLAFSCKAFRELLGFEPWNALNHPENHRHKIHFLANMDRSLPGHLLCIPCAVYHVRTQSGKETLRPANIQNFLFECPNAGNMGNRAPRTRITFGRTLPFTFVQLALRAHNHSPDHGINIDSLARRYKDQAPSTWSHQTRYAIVNNHLLMRVISTCFAPANLPPSGLRHLLYSREDFVPYFSVCAHWRDGELMNAVKCALGHIPKPLDGGGIVRVGKEFNRRFVTPPKFILRLCEVCEPMRRCPECPTEYHIQLKVTEDKSDPVNLFKQALVVTRWSDLGDGSSPWNREWAACNGESDEYDSFQEMGRRAVSGVFESKFNSDLIPGHRIISTNPNGEKLGEKGHNWY